MTEREIFLEALELDTPETRAAFLLGACGQDLTLRRKVEELLKEHFSNDSLLAGPAVQGGKSEVESQQAPAPKLDRYKLLEKLGEGGFGEVWMAEQREPVKRRVALKIIKLGMDSRQVVARFEAERQALAMMDHANIAKIFDAGTTDSGRPYFVMELVRGIKITEYCDQKQLPTQERLKLFILVCQAIQHAHQKGIIHRDIKPSNILVTLHDGVPVPKVIDFGIAKATQGELTDKTVFTQFQQFIGTPAYISPEQAEMSGLDVDTRADIYSLGVLLYELLVGATPFDAKEMMRGGLDALRQIIREKEPLRPSTKLNTLQGDARTTAGKLRQTDVGRLVHQLQGDLDWIVMKCLEKDRARRYETANGLAADIQRHMNNEPVVARPPSQLYEFQKTVKRHKFGFAAAGAVLMALAVGLGIATWTLGEERKARWRAEVAEQEQSRLREEAQLSASRAEQSATEAERQRKQAEALADENRYNLYAARIKVAEGQYRDGNAGEAQRLLDSVRPVAGQPDLRSFDWYHLWQLLHSETLSLAHEGHVLCLAYSPDGTLLATSGDDPVIHLWDAADGSERGQLVGHQSRTSTLAFAPDGKKLASGGADKTLRLWNVDGANGFRILQTGTNEITKLVFSKDGRFLVWSEGAIPVGVGGPVSAYSPRGSPGRVWVWDLVESRLVGNFIAQDNSVRCLAISPDGRKLLSGGDDQIAKLHDPATGSLIAVQTNLSGTIFGGGFSEDGKDAIVATWWPYQDSGEIVVLDGGSLERKRVLVADAGQILCLATSPDGKKLAGGGVDMIVRLWDTASGAELQTIRGHTEEVAAVTFTPDGKGLATGAWDARVKTWNAGTRPARQEFSTMETLSVAYSPDGKLLACASGCVEVRDAISGKLLRVLPEHRSSGIRVAFSPDGSVLAGTDDRGAVHFWNTASWGHWIGMQGDTKPAEGQNIWVDSHLAFFPDSKTLVVPGNDKIIRFWDVKTGVLKETINGYSKCIGSVDVTRDGETLVTGTSDQICFWDLKTKQVRYSLPESGVVLRLSPDGKQMLSGRYNFLLRDLPDLGIRQPIQGHKSIVFSLAFSPDNRLVATAGWDGVVKIWHRLSGQELLTIPTSGGLAWSVKFAPDNRSLAFSCGVGKGGKVVIIRAATEEKVEGIQGLSQMSDRFGRTGNWDEAAVALRKAMQAAPTDHWHYHRLAALLIWKGDLVAYRQHCARMLEQFATAKDRYIAERMVKDCLIHPASGVDPKVGGTLADIAVAGGEAQQIVSWFQFAKGLAEYRQGRFASTAEWMQLTLSHAEVRELTAQAYVVLAMAEHQLRHPEAARAALEKGAEIIEQNLPKLESGDIGDFWVDWIFAHVLYREAKALSEGEITPDPFSK